MHLNGDIFEKLNFWKLLKPKSLFLLDVFKHNVTMAVNKFQRSSLAFDLSAKVAHIGVLSIYWIIVFSETVRPIELKFPMKTPYDKLAKIYRSHDQDGRNAHIW